MSDPLFAIDQKAQGIASDGSVLIDFFLHEQQQLSAVERFSRIHETVLDTPQSIYRDLIPLSAPRAGEQYAFAVDLDACTGCKACVTACHSMNGLDEDEVWRTVGLVQSEATTPPIFQMVTAACHHCAHPACMLGCPAQAYAKDEFTGIVKHLDDQCIGCQYCVLKCPYDVPKYNPRRGIVRKCDMCSSRLAASQAPACVQACPNTAITITIVNTAQLAKLSSENDFLSGAPAPDYTLPATQYRRRTPLPAGSFAADRHRAAPQHVHFPLVVMLLLTQLAVGAFGFDVLASWLSAPSAPRLLNPAARPLFAGLAFASANLGLFAALFHLGRPLYAFRAVLGFRTSWMSREIVAFTAFMAVAGTYAGALWAPSLGWNVPQLASFQTILSSSTLFFGSLGVFCSMLIYVDTRREFWRASRTFPAFFLSAVWLSAAGLLLFNGIQANVFGASCVLSLKTLCLCVAAAAALKLALEGVLFASLRKGAAQRPLAKSAALLVRELLLPTCLRFYTGMLGGIFLPVLMLGFPPNPRLDLLFASAIFVLSLASEVFERTLYFRAVVPLKMPGSMAQ